MLASLCNSRPSNFSSLDSAMTDTARCVRADPATIWRWKPNLEFAAELKNRTADEMGNTRRVVGAQVRATADVALMATNELREILRDPQSPKWDAAVRRADGA